MSLILLSVFIPAIAGIMLLASSFKEHLKAGDAAGKGTPKSLRELHLYVGIILVLTAALALFTAWSGKKR